MWWTASEEVQKSFYEDCCRGVGGSSVVYFFGVSYITIKKYFWRVRVKVFSIKYNITWDKTKEYRPIQRNTINNKTVEWDKWQQVTISYISRPTFASIKTTLHFIINAFKTNSPKRCVDVVVVVNECLEIPCVFDDLLLTYA